MGAKPGHEVTPETRAKIRAALAGRKLSKPSPLIGRKQSPELVARRTAHQRKWGPICTIEGCGKRHSSRGWCSMHYWRWKNYGDPLQAPGPARSGEQNANWKGDLIGYDAIHLRARQATSPRCISCGIEDEPTEAALRRDTEPANLRGSSHGPYSISITDYVRLCITCHRRYDSPRPETRAGVEAAIPTR